MTAIPRLRPFGPSLGMTSFLSFPSEDAALGRDDRQRGPCGTAAALDEPSTQHAVAVVEHERLAGRNRGHRLLERKLDLAVIKPNDVGRRRLRTMTYLHLHATADRQWVDEPVHFASDDTASEERVTWSNDYRALGGSNRNDVHRLRKPAWHAAALADRVASIAVVLSDDATVGEHHRSARQGRRIVA